MSRRRARNAVAKSSSPMNIDYESVVRDAARLQMATQNIPRIVADEIKKGWHQLPNTDAQRSPKSWFYDPLALQYSLGYKDRRYSLSYDLLKRIVAQLS